MKFEIIEEKKIVAVSFQRHGKLWIIWNINGMQKMICIRKVCPIKRK